MKCIPWTRNNHKHIFATAELSSRSFVLFLGLQALCDLSRFPPSEHPDTVLGSRRTDNQTQTTGPSTQTLDEVSLTISVFPSLLSQQQRRKTASRGDPVQEIGITDLKLKSKFLFGHDTTIILVAYPSAATRLECLYPRLSRSRETCRN